MSPEEREVLQKTFDKLLDHGYKHGYGTGWWYGFGIGASVVGVSMTLVWLVVH